MKRLLLLLAATPFVFGCTKEHKFESVVQLLRREVVEKDDKGEPVQIDVEVEWDPCPGDQFQVLRGGKSFAACMQNYPLGDYLPVRVKHWWDDRGYYRWDIYQIGDCKREIETESEGSYEKSQECKDHTNFGRTTGFACNRRPFKKLVAVCPWMARN